MSVERNLRAYYSADISQFMGSSDKAVFGEIEANSITHEVTIQQKNTWIQEVAILREQLKEFEEGRILFEYVIPRMGKRVDVVFLHNNIVYLLEFKCGDKEYKSSTFDQVYDYANDLRNFQKESHTKLLVPIAVSTDAPAEGVKIVEQGHILDPIPCNSSNIGYVIRKVAAQYVEPQFDYVAWEQSEYLPTPTIVEAAQALFHGHHVEEITRNDAENLSVTTGKISDIIDYSKRNNRKSICFVTGVPGAGKTLVGLKVAIDRADAEKQEHAVFLSGNFPLVQVLQEALARDKVQQEKEKGNKLKKDDARRSTAAFIQIIHKYRDTYVGNDDMPPDRVVIFDEAQRSWTKEMLSDFMKTKKGILDFEYSEPEFLIETMDRHDDWAVIVCLVGGGQEINRGEAGLPEWFDSLQRSFKNWDVYIAPNLKDDEYRMSHNWDEMTNGLNVTEDKGLHLSSSVRSFRTPNVSAFVKAMLDIDREKAKMLYQTIEEKYNIYVTRDLKVAKDWVKSKCRYGTNNRFGLLASSGALRLKPEGIFVKNDINVANWFLNGKDDVRSSFALEDVVTEFDIQGLEIDYSIVAWDANFRMEEGEWHYYNFSGSSWKNEKTEERRMYLKNSYRVLLTRARQGMIIYIPMGSDEDRTRDPRIYNETFEYLRSIGLKEM